MRKVIQVPPELAMIINNLSTEEQDELAQYARFIIFRRSESKPKSPNTASTSWSKIMDPTAVAKRKASVKEASENASKELLLSSAGMFPAEDGERHALEDLRKASLI